MPLKDASKTIAVAHLGALVKRLPSSSHHDPSPTVFTFVAIIFPRVKKQRRPHQPFSLHIAVLSCTERVPFYLSSTRVRNGLALTAASRCTYSYYQCNYQCETSHSILVSLSDIQCESLLTFFAELLFTAPFTCPSYNCVCRRRSKHATRKNLLELSRFFSLLLLLFILPLESQCSVCRSRHFGLWAMLFIGSED